MQRNLALRILFPRVNKAPLLIARVKEKPLPIQSDFNYADFSAHFCELRKKGNQEELFSYFEQMIDNLKKPFNHPYRFLDFILYQLDESTYGLISDFGTEWLRQNGLFNDLDFLVKLLNRSSVKHWKFFLDCVGREWLDSRLDYKTLYGLLYHLVDDRYVREPVESLYLRHHTLFSYLGQESIRKIFTPENLGNYILRWRGSSTDKAYYVLLNFLDDGDREIKNSSNMIATTDEEHTQLIELDRERWLTVSVDDEGWLRKNFSMGHALGAALHNSATPTAVITLFGFPILTTLDPYIEGSLPKPRDEILNGWEPFLKYLPNWQETILTTPGELKALFKGNENCEPELIYLLLKQTPMAQMSIEQTFELMEALSGQYLHAWLLKDKNPQQIEANIVAQNDKSFYRVYLYATAKAALYEEEQSEDKTNWWGVSKSQRVSVARSLMNAIYENKPSEYQWGCNNGFSGMVRKFYMQMLDKYALENSAVSENAITFTRHLQLK